jgi:hypothetical protein
LQQQSDPGAGHPDRAEEDGSSLGGRGADGDAKLKAIKYNLGDIRTTDQTPRKNSCAANFIMDNAQNHQEFIVNYTAERTDDGRLYVTLLDF